MEKVSQFGNKLTTQSIILETRKDGVKLTNSKLKKLGGSVSKDTRGVKELPKGISKANGPRFTFFEVFYVLVLCFSSLSQANLMQ